MKLYERLDGLIKCRSRRWFAFIFGIIEIIWFSGVHYGYNALIPAFEELGVFGDQCVETDCTQRNKLFSYAFIVSVVAQMLLIPLAGLLMDRVSLRVGKLVSVFLESIGLIMFAFTAGKYGPLLFAAMVFICYSSLASLLCNHHISSQFPQARALVISLLSGAYDSSTSIFSIFSQTYPKISLQTSFLILAFCGLAYGIFMAIFFLTQYTKDMANFGPTIEYVDVVDETESKIEQLTEAPVETLDAKLYAIITKRYATVKSCLRSWPFLLVCIWFMFGLLRFSYFFAQLSSQLDIAFKDQKEVVDKLKFISSAISMCGILIAPITGITMDFSRKLYHRQISKQLNELNDNQIYWIHLRFIAPAVTIMATASLILSGIIFVHEQQWAYYVAFISHMILRSFLFSTAVTFVFAAFPVIHFGTVYGLINLTGGVISLLQYALIAAPATVSNAFCVVISIILYIPALVLFFKPSRR